MEQTFSEKCHHIMILSCAIPFTEETLDMKNLLLVAKEGVNINKLFEKWCFEFVEIFCVGFPNEIVDVFRENLRE